MAGGGASDVLVAAGFARGFACFSDFLSLSFFVMIFSLGAPLRSWT
jgi:hypothetical protein